MAVPARFPTSYLRARKYRRFDLQFPVCLNFQSEGKIRRVKGISKNVSVGGLLLKAGAQIPLRTHVNLIINVVSPWAGRQLRLNATGEIVRVEALAARGFAIAVECKHPISKMRKHLYASGAAH